MMFFLLVFLLSILFARLLLILLFRVPSFCQLASFIRRLRVYLLHSFVSFLFYILLLSSPFFLCFSSPLSFFSDLFLSMLSLLACSYFSRFVYLRFAISLLSSTAFVFVLFALCLFLILVLF